MYGKKSLYERLENACRHGDEKTLKVLLLKRNGRTIDFQHDYGLGETLLSIACAQRHLRIVCELLRYPGCDVNHCDSRRLTPLYYACNNQSEHIVKALLRHKAVKVDENALITACHMGNLNILQALLSHPSCPSCTQEQSAGVLTRCISQAEVDVIKILLSHQKINVLSLQQDGRNALHLACQENQLEIVNLLLEDGRFDINQKSKQGVPFLLAVRARAYLVALRLLKRGADILLVEGAWDVVYKQYDQNNAFKTAILLEMLVALFSRQYLWTLKDQELYQFKEISCDENTRKGLSLFCNTHRLVINQRLAIREKYQQLQAARTFAIIIYFGDNYLKMKQSNFMQKILSFLLRNDNLSNAERFLRIAARLPMDLQMTLCNRMWKLREDNIANPHKTEGFKAVNATMAAKSRFQIG